MAAIPARPRSFPLGDKGARWCRPFPFDEGGGASTAGTPEGEVAVEGEGGTAAARRKRGNARVIGPRNVAKNIPAKSTNPQPRYRQVRYCSNLRRTTVRSQ